jgi:hypothetical protein
MTEMGAFARRFFDSMRHWMAKINNESSAVFHKTGFSVE